MLAKHIEVVRIDARLVGALQALAQLNIENAKAQPEGCFSISIAMRQPQPVSSNLRMDTRPRRRRG